eukprot:TRINITY_DN846_c0_g1_i1.p1 TRINITY_DN846_c0_g1~~TRINITY_DN846_c0_g1_i1.p1  ORF type:complete len:372 (+),score=93.76 TRINITY_DN846_c0_g1_i1:486-1601(+)
MGLSQSVSAKVLERYGNKMYRVGVATMNGFREDWEDAHKVILSLPSLPQYSYFAIFDGHSGEATSRFCSENLHQYIEKHVNAENIEELEKFVFQACRQLDLDILGPGYKFLEYNKHQFTSNDDVGEKVEFPKTSFSGSTGIFSLIQKQDDNNYEVLVGNVGDSECFLGRVDENGNVTCVALSKSHKPDNEEERSRIEKAGGEVSFCRVDGQLALSRAFGDIEFKHSNLVNDYEDHKVIALPTFIKAKVTPNDFLVLNCDGITEKMSGQDVVYFVHKELSETSDLAKIAGHLCDESLKRGSKDNMSVIIITFKDGVEYSQKEQEFIPSPVSDVGDRYWIKAYKQFAKAHGIDVKLDEKPDREWDYDRNNKHD